MKSSLGLTRKLSPFAVRLSWFLVLILILPWLVGVGQASTPTDILVNSTEDVKNNDGQCTLREAIIAANSDKRSGGKPGECAAGNGPDTIILPAGTYFLTRTDNGKEDAGQTGDLDITGDLTIVGGPGVTIDASGITDRVFHILSGEVTISGVTIKNGGGNVSDGGGIYNGATLMLTNVTLSGNTAGGSGGGIYNTLSLTLNNSTIANNTAATYGGGIVNSGVTVNFQNTIIAGNTAASIPDDCSDMLSSLGHNLVGDGTGCPSTDTDVLVSPADVFTTVLGPLQADFSGTQVHALLGGSPAIDTGNNDTCEATDQRGEVRPLDGDNDGQARCDIGAFELRYNNFVLIRAFPNDEGGTTIHGLLDGATGSTVNLDFFSHVPICPADMSQPFDSAQVTTDENGYFTAHLGTAVPDPTDPTADPPASSFFLTSTATDLNGSTLGLSNCVSVGSNTSWPLALSLHSLLIGDGTADIDQYIDKLGQSRWYRFKIEPNSEVVVTLTDLAANYDLTIYKDVKAAFLAFLVPAEDDLVPLNAQFAGDAFAGDAFAGDAFAGDAFAGDAFAGDAFAGDAFAGDAFAGDAFAGDAFAGDAFAGDAFAGDAFAGDAFAGDAFAGDAFAGDAFAGDAFAGDAFAGDAFAAAFSSAQMQSLIGISAFEGTTSEGIFVNTWNNTGEFYVRVRGRNGASDPKDSFHLRVTVVTGACSGINDNGFGDNTHTATAGGYSTIILTDLNRMDVEGPDEEEAFEDLPAKLANLAADVNGVVVDVGGSDFERVIKANEQADDHPNCPYAKNLVAQEIKDVIDDYRAINPLEYVAIIGDDDVIPFFRHPDNALLAPESQYSPPVRNSTPSQASLKLDYVLSQDAYGSKFDLSLNNSTYPIPELAVGRLVETAIEINAMLDAFDSAGGAVAPQTSLSTGYDFMADAAYLIGDELGEGTGSAPQWLITDGAPTVDPTGWTADDLRTELFKGPDIAFLAGHFTTNAALAADYNTVMSSSEVAESNVDMANSVIFSVGCHAGYNTVDDHGLNILDQDGNVIVTRGPDWAQAFAGQGATLVAGTGYQYGETDFLEYSERIYLEFSRQLRRVGPEPVAIGKALMEAKKVYLRQTPQIRGLHEKALLEATVFGLPMLKVNLDRNYTPPTPNQPTDFDLDPPYQTFDTDPGATLGLRYDDVTVESPLNPHSVQLTNIDTDPHSTLQASYLSGTPYGAGNPFNDELSAEKRDVSTNLGEPALPLEVRDVAKSGTTLRGVGFRGGIYAEQDVIPLTGAPATEISNVHTPFLTNYFYPVQMWRMNYWDVLDNPNVGITQLIVTPAQHKISLTESTPQRSTRRHFSQIDLRLYYSNNVENFPTPDPDDPNMTINSRPALSGAPTIIRVGADPDPDTGIVAFEALVTGNPAAGIQEVWVTYTVCPVAGCNGQWVSLDLEQSPVHSTIWRGELDLDAAGIANAADIFYMVQAVNGVGLVSRVDNQGKFFVPGVTPAETELQFVSVPTEGDFGTMATFSAMLTYKQGGAPIAGQPVTFRLGTANKSGLGDVSGVALTGSDGIAEIHLPLRALPGDYQLRAFFDGTATLQPTDVQGGEFAINKQGTILSLSPPSATVLPGEEPGIEATLTDDTGRRLHARTVFFVVKDHDNPGSGPFYSVHTITNWRGHVSLGPVNLPAGVYDVNAYFNGTIDLDPTDPDPETTVTLDDDGYEPAFASGRLTINTPPVADDQSVETDEDTPVGITLTASDPDGDPLTFAVVDSPSNGTLSGDAPNLIYTPDADFNGDDSFTFQVNDGIDDSNVATVTITVNPVNDPPVANNDDFSLDKNTSATFDVTANDTDVDGNLDPTSANTVCPTCSEPSNGMLVNNGDGTFTYTPDENFFGSDSFSYEVCDTDKVCDTATVNITINPANDPPVANNDDCSLDEDTSATFDVTANDTDVDGNLDPTSANTDCATCSGPSNGTLVNNGDGTFTYTPDENFFGSDSFNYEVCDTDGVCDTATVTITVNPVNDPPVANNDDFSLDENTSATFDVTANDTDVDGNLDPTSANTDCATCSGPSNGTLVNNGDGTFTYTPDENFFGSDSFSYEVCDTDGACDTAMVNITVHSVNHPPDCSGAEPSDRGFWPPNNDFVSVHVIGVTDPDGDLLSIEITGIFQDEKVGKGKSFPDGDGLGMDTAQIRVERDGKEDGRVYHIDFTASDGQGGTCFGELRVAVVPHDQSDELTSEFIDSIDGGRVYNSVTGDGPLP